MSESNTGVITPRHESMNERAFCFIIICIVIGAGIAVVAISSNNAQSNSDSTSITVYITRTGEKYHRSSCHYLSQSKIAIELQDAINQGYDSCSVCNPPTSYP